MKLLVIGDPHFKAKATEIGDIFISQITEKAKSIPDLDGIVVLGDTLDTFDVSKVTPFNQAYNFLKNLSEIAHVYLIIGNHDMPNSNTYLSTMHFFHPYKHWSNITVIDFPVCVNIKGVNIGFCPYVPPGKFYDAMDEMLVEHIGLDSWEGLNCIFVHQEFNGVKYAHKDLPLSSDAVDSYYEGLPFCISGHIHQHQTVGHNLFYIGSPYQHNYGESAEKFICTTTFTPSADEDETAHEISIVKIRLDMKKKYDYSYSVGDIDTSFDWETPQFGDVKLTVKGTEDEIKTFRKSATYKRLLKLKVKVCTTLNSQSIQKMSERLNLKKSADTSFISIFENLVLNTSPELVDVYKQYCH